MPIAHTTQLIIGALFVIYGLVKVAFGVYFATHPEKKRDRTQAAKIIDYTVLAFGIYTLMHGAAILGWLPASLAEHINSMFVTAIVYSAFGLFLIVFALFVLFTDKIERDDRFMLTYEVVGLFGGFLFVMSSVWIMFRERVVSKTVFVFIMLELVACVLLMAMYMLYQKRNNRIDLNELKALVMVPLGVTA